MIDALNRIALAVVDALLGWTLSLPSDISLLALAGATARYLLPTRYILDEREAAWRQLTWRRRSWSTFRRVDRHADGIFLSPFRRPSRLDSFRGVFLRFGPGVDAGEVVALARARVPA